jgi:hypothetical protein
MVSSDSFEPTSVFWTATELRNLLVRRTGGVKKSKKSSSTKRAGGKKSKKGIKRSKKGGQIFQALQNIGTGFKSGDFIIYNPSRSHQVESAMYQWNPSKKLYVMLKEYAPKGNGIMTLDHEESRYMPYKRGGPKQYVLWRKVEKPRRGWSATLSDEQLKSWKKKKEVSYPMVKSTNMDV